MLLVVTGNLLGFPPKCLRLCGSRGTLYGRGEGGVRWIPFQRRIETACNSLAPPQLRKGGTAELKSVTRVPVAAAGSPVKAVVPSPNFKFVRTGSFRPLKQSTDKASRISVSLLLGTSLVISCIGALLIKLEILDPSCEVGRHPKAWLLPSFKGWRGNDWEGISQTGLTLLAEPRITLCTRGFLVLQVLSGALAVYSEGNFFVFSRWQVTALSVEGNRWGKWFGGPCWSTTIYTLRHQCFHFNMQQAEPNLEYSSASVTVWECNRWTQR